MRTKLSLCSTFVITALFSGSTFAAGINVTGQQSLSVQNTTPQIQTVQGNAYIIFDITRTSGVYGIVGAGSPSSWRTFVPVCPPTAIPYPGTWNPKLANNSSPLSQSDTQAFNYPNYRCMCQNSCSASSPLWGMSTTGYAWGSAPTGYNTTSTIVCLLPTQYIGPASDFANGPPVLYYSSSPTGVTTDNTAPKFHYDAWTGGASSPRPVPAKYGYVDPNYAMALDYKACNISPANNSPGPNDPTSPSH